MLRDNFHVQTKTMAEVREGFTFAGNYHEVTGYVNQATETGLSIGANVIHSIESMAVREISRRCSYDADQLIRLAGTSLIIPVHSVPRP